MPARTIARDMDIPVRFLPQVLADLTRAELVEARLGRSGGYRLTRDPAHITLLDVIEAVEGDARRQTCVLTGRGCGTAAEPCSVHEVFNRAQLAILTRLAGTTVADIVAHASSSPPGPDMATEAIVRTAGPREGPLRAPVLLVPPVRS